jgi:N-acetylglucosaminyl-diphospho-decaprenol L-rhamnosyltransferase
MKLLIVIVNYRTADLTIGALASVEPELASVAPARVIVVDNCSGDGSADRIDAAITARGWGGWAMLLRAERNGGFAYGNNRGVEKGFALWPKPAYVHLLNPDTVVRPDGLAALVRFMDGNPTIGIGGSRLEDPNGTPQASAFRFPGVLSELDRAVQLGVLTRVLSRWVSAAPITDQPCPTDWVAGASMIIRCQVLEAIGLLDERYFLYFEEVAFIRQALLAGWPCWYVPTSRVVHLVGQASGVTDPRQSRRRRPDYWFESRRRYLLTNLGPGRAAIADLAHLLGLVAWRARCLIERKADNTPAHLLADSLRHSVFAKGFTS